MYLGHNVEYDDLVSYGIFGLIDAIDKFDLEKNVNLKHMRVCGFSGCYFRPDS
ncbi:MAG: sigma factor [Lachnospira sp.]